MHRHFSVLIATQGKHPTVWMESRNLGNAQRYSAFRTTANRSDPDVCGKVRLGYAVTDFRNRSDPDRSESDRSDPDRSDPDRSEPDRSDPD